MNNNLLTETTLNGSLNQIVTSLKTLMDSFWIYIVIALAAVVVVWGAYVGIKIAIAHKNEDKINAMLPDKLPKDVQKIYNKAHK